MHYKKILISILISTSFYSNSEIINSPYSEGLALAESYINYEKKVGECSSYRHRKINMDNIDTSWISTLDQKTMEAVIIFIHSSEQDSCSEKERGNYVITLVNYTIKTKDRTALDDWLKLHKVIIETDSMRESLNKLNPDDFYKFVSNPEFKKGFDVFDAIDKFNAEM
ncbi:Putative uncharacterized protein [Moritella viscosa]|uniref:Uncharacterized protein n=2 Tax=Moritella viscosa TaxID=80854 RepID=A0A1L0C5M5_9GAMM|nr:Putative uncharacterized protein [Moritella viscosa]SGZ15005.1 Putative uncharacterized protein [Moritella viscosa]SGZ15730.1 Putative uncharacterized protein [Moritella viscosa]SHO28247.1 Putative uncharacterized protein [Moritella viscosa]